MVVGKDRDVAVRACAAWIDIRCPRRFRSAIGRSMSANGVRLVRFLERASVIVAQLDVERTYCAFQMLDLGSSDDWCRDASLLEKPGECNF